MDFEYEDEAIEYLKEKDEILSKVIDYVGPISVPIERNIFAGITYHILGQQISVIVQDTIWDRLKEKIGEVTPENVVKLGKDELRALGMTNRKAETIYNIAQSIVDGEFDFYDLEDLSDDEVIKELTKIKGVGKWTAEMLLMFSYNRPDVFTFGDVALNRGLKMMYGLEEIDKKTFEHFKELFSPYGTLASLYIWAVGEYKKEGIKEFVESIQERLG